MVKKWSTVLVAMALLLAMAMPLVTMAADWPVRILTPPDTLDLPYSDYSSRDSTYAAGRDWVKVALESDNTMYLISTDDQGQSWENATLWHAPSWNRDLDYCYDGTYFHFATTDFTEESDNYSILYRRGAPQTDGSITWSTENWQVAVAYAGTYVYEDPKIAVGDDGEPFIAYEQADKDTFLDISICVARSNATEGGTWSANWSDSQVSADHNFFSVCCVAEDIYLVVSEDEESQLYAWTYSNVGFADLVTRQAQGEEGDLFYVYQWSMVRSGDSVELVYSVYEALTESAVYWMLGRTYDTASGLWSAPVTIDTWPYMNGAVEVDVSVALAGDDVYAFWPYEEWEPFDDGLINVAGQVRYAKKVDGLWEAPVVWIDVFNMGISIDTYDLDTTAGTNAEEHVPVVFMGSTDEWMTSDTWFTGLDVTATAPTPPDPTDTGNFVPAVAAYMVMMLLINVPMVLAGRAGYEVSGTLLGLINLLFVLVALMVILFPYLST